MHRQAAAVRRPHLPHPGAEPLGRRSASRHLDVAVDHHGLRRRPGRPRRTRRPGARPRPARSPSRRPSRPGRRRPRCRRPARPRWPPPPRPRSVPPPRPVPALTGPLTRTTVIPAPGPSIAARAAPASSSPTTRPTSRAGSQPAGRPPSRASGRTPPPPSRATRTAPAPARSPGPSAAGAMRLPVQQPDLHVPARDAAATAPTPAPSLPSRARRPTRAHRRRLRSRTAEPVSSAEPEAETCSTASAPSSDASASADDDTSTATTRAPSATPVITADSPTPPHPCTASHWPSPSRPWSTTARNAVANRHPSEAAATSSRPSGSATRLRSAACTATSSANDPQPVNPGWVWSGHTCGSPAAHHEHRPQPQTNGSVTRCPAAHLVTEAPTDSTTPASSCPGTCGSATVLVPLPGVPVRPAHPGGPDPQHHAVVRAHRVRHVAHRQRSADLVEHDGAHGVRPRARRRPA